MEGREARELGRLEGKVDEMNARFDRVERAIDGLRQTGSAEHAAVGVKIDALAREFNGALEVRDNRIDSLESDRDQARGALQLGGFVKGIAGFVVAALGYILGTGRHP
jgi:outer membrane murein-binding lipoprotein Lpp